MGNSQAAKEAKKDTNPSNVQQSADEQPAAANKDAKQNTIKVQIKIDQTRIVEFEVPKDSTLQKVLESLPKNEIPENWRSVHIAVDGKRYCIPTVLLTGRLKVVQPTSIRLLITDKMSKLDASQPEINLNEPFLKFYNNYIKKNNVSSF